MIHSITFPKSKKAYTYTSDISRRKSSHKSPFAYIAETLALAGKTFNFKPGLNILLGQNGSGKSTILKACGLSLAAVQGGQSTITEEWIRELFGSMGESITFPWSVKHNGQPAVFVDPRTEPGLVARGSAFDNSFLSMGVSNLMFRGSTGEKTLHQINRVIGMLIGKEPVPTEIVRKIDKKAVNAVWEYRIGLADEYLKGDGTPGPVTVLLDEPESCLSIPMQVGFWKRLMSEDPSRFDNLQVIVATHSPFALDVPGANYIELGEGYLVECRTAIRPTFDETKVAL